ncbi:hypothetical protein AABB24_021438 [Solanum stoloniferum]|uniref:Uncharacterized protein n=1 Tax=Solanum stoloniferum TaxID=62892 RepID=A0ABD2SV28_9SOLN
MIIFSLCCHEVFSLDAFSWIYPNDDDISDCYGHLRNTQAQFYIFLWPEELLLLRCLCYLSSPGSIFLCLSCHLILFVWMHVCRPHGDHEGIRFGNFEVWSHCVSFPCAPCFCAILVLALALKFGYHQALARELNNLVWHL